MKLVLHVQGCESLGNGEIHWAVVHSEINHYKLKLNQYNFNLKAGNLMSCKTQFFITHVPHLIMVTFIRLPFQLNPSLAATVQNLNPPCQQAFCLLGLAREKQLTYHSVFSTGKMPHPLTLTAPWPSVCTLAAYHCISSSEDQVIVGTEIKSRALSQDCRAEEQDSSEFFTNKPQLMNSALALRRKTGIE